MKVSGSVIAALFVLFSTLPASASRNSPSFDYVRWKDRCERLEIKIRCTARDRLMIIRDSCDDIVDGSRMVIAEGVCEWKTMYLHLNLSDAPAGTKLFLRSTTKGCDDTNSIIVPECSR